LAPSFYLDKAKKNPDSREMDSGFLLPPKNYPLAARGFKQGAMGFR